MSGGRNMAAGWKYTAVIGERWSNTVELKRRAPSDCAVVQLKAVVVAAAAAAAARSAKNRNSAAGAVCIENLERGIDCSCSGTLVCVVVAVAVAVVL
jgi:hypothetical protein